MLYSSKAPTLHQQSLVGHSQLGHANGKQDRPAHGQKFGGSHQIDPDQEAGMHRRAEQKKKKAYLEARALEFGGTIRSVFIFMSALLSVVAPLLFAFDHIAIGSIVMGMAVVLWGGVFVLGRTDIGKVYVEAFATALATYLLLAMGIITDTEYSAVAANRELCESLNITISFRNRTSGEVGDWDDVEGMSGDYCADLIDDGAGQLDGRSLKFVMMYALWLTFTLIALLLFRTRFVHSLPLVLFPGAVQIARGFAFLINVCDYTPERLVMPFILLYLPALVFCLWFPYSSERLHRIRYILLCKLAVKVKHQSIHIANKTNEIDKMKERLRKSQKIVSDAVKQTGLTVAMDAYKIPYASLAFLEELGYGSFGTVYHGRIRKTMQEVAIKTVRATKISPKIVTSFLMELEIMAPLRHENLVALVGGCWEDGPDKLCIVLEFCAHGTVKDLLREKKATWENTYYGIALAIAGCFNYLHNKQPSGVPIIHRDLKPANVLLTSKCVPKVADFGASRRFTVVEATECDNKNSMTMTVVGTPMFCAPEIINNARYNERVDVYSFAIMLLEMACGNLRIREQFKRFGKAGVARGWRPKPPDELVTWLPDVWKLVQQCWKQNASERADFGTVVLKLVAMGSTQGTSTNNRNLVKREVRLESIEEGDEVIDAQIAVLRADLRRLEEQKKSATNSENRLNVSTTANVVPSIDGRSTEQTSETKTLLTDSISAKDDDTHWLYPMV